MANSGKEGEKLFQQIMEQRGHQVINVSADPDYYHRGDFILVDRQGIQRIVVEVKWDERIHQTNNLYLEVINTDSFWSGGDGWWKYCKCDYLAYGDAINKKFYIFDMKQLKEKVATLPKVFADCGKNSRGQLVNINSLRDIIIKEI